MTQEQTDKYRNQAEPLLEAGEQLLDIAVIVPTKGARSVGLGATRAVGEGIAGIGAVKGGPGSIANDFPPTQTGWYHLLCVTDRRVFLVLTPPGHSEARVAKGLSPPPRLAWQAPRASVVGVEGRPRLQMMAKFRLHFVDGSSVSVLTMRKRTVESLAGVLGAAHQNK
jgi:hypothetical protein